MRYPDGYRPPHAIRRSIWPRVMLVLLTLAAWGLVALIGILIGHVVSMFR